MIRYDQPLFNAFQHWIWRVSESHRITSREFAHPFLSASLKASGRDPGRSTGRSSVGRADQHGSTICNEDLDGFVELCSGSLQLYTTNCFTKQSDVVTLVTQGFQPVTACHSLSQQYCGHNSPQKVCMMSLSPLVCGDTCQIQLA